MAIAKMEKGVNVFTEDAKEQAEFSFIGDIKEAKQQKSAATDNNVVAQKSSKKPVPWVKKYVAFGGYLTGISASLEGETLQERFRIEWTALPSSELTLPWLVPLLGRVRLVREPLLPERRDPAKRPASVTTPSPTKRAREDEGPDSGAPSSPSPFHPPLPRPPPLPDNCLTIVTSTQREFAFLLY
ncbi:hypothetical protein B0H14DRAFT_2604033 [Mycena olivaceomarginata]|nr:hypothetical protein B0H14DRAFT_2604033 [Mycena olivaceomarginata]